METDEDAGKEAHIEGEDVDVVCGAPGLAIIGFELQGFNFSEVVHRKRLEGQTLSEGVVSPFHVFTSSRFTLAGAFRGDYVAACSTALRSTTEENDSGGYVDVPCPSKVKQRKITVDWLKVL